MRKSLLFRGFAKKTAGTSRYFIHNRARIVLTFGIKRAIMIICYVLWAVMRPSWADSDPIKFNGGYLQ